MGERAGHGVPLQGRKVTPEQRLEIVDKLRCSLRARCCSAVDPAVLSWRLKLISDFRRISVPPSFSRRVEIGKLNSVVVNF